MMAMKQKTCFPSEFPRGKVAYFVTSNIHKFQEAQLVLSVKNCGLPVFVEDAGLFVEALNGFPGPYSKYVYNTVGVKGILKLMKNVENRKAYFMSVVAFGSPDEQPTCFIGKVNGTLSLQEMGTSGFGYDPIFVPSKGDGRTFAKMTTTEKNGYSHRTEALRKFALWYSSFNKRRF
jgi:XTP/dITP diphosphohydrolase